MCDEHIRITENKSKNLYRTLNKYIRFVSLAEFIFELGIEGKCDIFFITMYTIFWGGIVMRLTMIR